MNFFHALVLASIAAVAIGLVAQRLFRNAATRHAVLLASLLLPPVLAIAAVSGLRLPAGSVATTDGIVEAVAPTATVSSREVQLPALVVAVWLAGVAISLARIVMHAVRWRAVALRAQRANGRSHEVREPTVIGIVTPVIVLPAAYDFTPAELDAVFAHERAHIDRRDNLTALLVQLVCAAFWFDPLHHIARRKIVELRERAVDDEVLALGCDAEAYVSALARSCETSFHTPAVACMSRLNLQERMESIMTHHTRRRWPAVIVRGGIAVAVAVTAIAFATFAPAPANADEEKKEVTRPRPIHRVYAKYPEEAKAKRITGLVTLEVSVDEKGTVADVRVVKPLQADLDQAAIDAMRQWKFEPATRDGKPVATKLQMTFSFRLD